MSQWKDRSLRFMKSCVVYTSSLSRNTISCASVGAHAAWRAQSASAIISVTAGCLASPRTDRSLRFMKSSAVLTFSLSRYSTSCVSSGVAGLPI